jgi:phosphoglycerate kinase
MQLQYNPNHGGCQMEKGVLDSRLRLVQQADMKDKVVLVRVDHNVVKSGEIKDPYRIDSTFGTLYLIAEKGGRPILMTHVGRPKDKKTGKIKCREEESVKPIVQYLEQKLPIKVHAHEFPIDPEKGITQIDDSINPAIEDLKKGKIGMIYLPNSRWFQGEEAKGPERKALATELAAMCDLYVNDAFGSYRAHASTHDVAMCLPSFAGILLQKEIKNLHRVLSPERPFVAVIAGAKYDTKIGPLNALYSKVDHLILGGLIYNTILSAKYGIRIAGVSEEDKALAKELAELDKSEKKILEMPYLVESDTIEGKIKGQYRSIGIEAFEQDKELKYLLDIDPRSMDDQNVRDVMGSAKTIFVNAVMGMMPHFFDGSQALYRLIASNGSAMKLFGGGDTLQEIRNLCPGIYLSGLDRPDTYYFTGGGSVLAAIEEGSPYQLKPVQALMEGND